MSRSKSKEPTAPAPVDPIEEIEAQIKDKRTSLATMRSSTCFPLFLRSASIGHSLVDDIFDDLKSNFCDCQDIDVIVDSSGGSIDAAYNIATLFRRYANGKLTFIIPRWAKSAATLLACSGDEILMTPPAELGPLDPQITQMNPPEKRIEQFSPLHIESTLGLIRDEFDKGHEKLAAGLMNRLQFPLTLGSFKKALEVSREYMFELLSTGMLKGNDSKAREIAEKFTTGYVDHGFCIKVAEASRIGLNATEMVGDQLDIVWDIHKT
jgi:Serine dehydrogenase proteinase